MLQSHPHESTLTTVARGRAGAGVERLLDRRAGGDIAAAAEVVFRVSVSQYAEEVVARDAPEIGELAEGHLYASRDREGRGGAPETAD